MRLSGCVDPGPRSRGQAVLGDIQAAPLERPLPGSPQRDQIRCRAATGEHPWWAAGMPHSWATQSSATRSRVLKACTAYRWLPAAVINLARAVAVVWLLLLR